nr:polysaccharide deacetylase family protein [Lachnospiraceae bacterium]
MSLRKKLIILLTSLAVLLGLAAFVVWGGGRHIEFDGISSERIVWEYGTPSPVPEVTARLAGSNFIIREQPLSVRCEGGVPEHALGEFVITYEASWFLLKATAEQKVLVTDTTPPVITLQQREGYYTRPVETYEEEGFTAADAFDGDLTDKVQRTEPGDGFIYYKVTDSRGNTAETRRAIPFDDRTAPELTLKGEAELLLDYEDVFKDPGCTAVDDCDGDISGLVIRDEAPGHWPNSTLYTYHVKDNYGNEASVVRLVKRTDRKPPAIELEGPRHILTEDPEEYEEAGYAAADRRDGDLTDRVCRTVRPLPNGPGLLLRYTVRDSSGNTASAARLIHLADFEPPVVQLAGAADITLPLDGTFTEPGYSAWDSRDGDLTGKVQVEKAAGDGDPEEVYIYTYTVTDSFGNRGEAQRIVRYRDMVAPVITLRGDSSVTLEFGQSFEDPWATAEDNLEGDISARIQVSGGVDVNQAGTYTLTYSVTDSYGNTGSATRQVTVKAKPTPTPPTPVTPVTGEKIVYLTFDDGPWQYTEHLLEVLARYNVKATFFVTNQFPGYSWLLAREAEAGHTVAMHTATHNFNQVYSSEQAYFDDLSTIENIVAQQTGRWPKMLRFPGGSSNQASSFNPGIMTRLTQEVLARGYQYFDWNVTSGDGSYLAADQVVANVINGISTKDVSIVLMHDINPPVAEATERIIQWGLNNGYTFLPLQWSSPPCHHTVFNALDTIH